MRLWSLHPKYLDSKGLVALWREALLAKAVLQGKTRGYTQHPQLERFRSRATPVEAVDAYLAGVLGEADARGYRFDGSKVGAIVAALEPIPVTHGQVVFEAQHLRRKLMIRDPEAVERLPVQDLQLALHPLFTRVDGDIEPWERGASD